MNSRFFVFLNCISISFFSPYQFATAATEVNSIPVEFGCQFHANEYFSESSMQDETPGAAEYLELLTASNELEEQLIQLDSTNSRWIQKRAETLLKMAGLKQAIGDTAQARSLYEEALYNMRINDGVHNIQQLPVILDLIPSFMLDDEEFTDQLADRAVFILEKNYAGEEQIGELIEGYTTLLNLRLNAHFSFDRDRSIHSRKAAQLQLKIDRLMTKLYNSDDPALRQLVSHQPEYYTHYDDLGKAVDSPNSGFDQVSGSTGEILEAVQTLLRREGYDQQADYKRAKQLLDRLHDDYDVLSPVDQTALLDFSADVFLALDDIPQTIASYEKLLRIRVLRPDYQLRALRALGQLYEMEERWVQSIDTYNCWRQLTSNEDSRVFLGLANAYREQEQHELAIHHLLKYMEFLESRDEIAAENLYVVLKELYYEIDQFDAGAEVVREMTALFD